MTDDDRASRSSRSVYGSQEETTPARSRQPFLGRIAYRILWIPIWCLIKIVLRLRVEGKERFPDGPFILAPVHRSFIDTPVAGMVTSRRLRFMGKESLWDSRLLGAFLSVMGGFPVERGAVDRTALRAAEDVLALGEPLVMFPEGTRREGPRLRREDMLDGPAFVSARSGVPIVPVGLGGTVRALPIGAKIPRFRKVIAVVGDPIYPPRIEGRVPRRVVRELSEQLFQDLGDLYIEARALVGEE